MSSTKDSKELKVFMVDVEIHVEIPVVAASKEEAQKIAEDVWEEDFRMGNEPDNVFSSAAEIMKSDDGYTIPYGVDDDHPRRDWSIKQWLEAQGEQADG